MIEPSPGYVDDAAGFDDEALEEIEALLWKGYRPQPYFRLDRPVWGYDPDCERTARAAGVHNRQHVRPERPVLPLYEAFRCDRCGRRLLSPIGDAEAEQEYRDAFGEAAPEERLTLCERCFDEMMLPA